MINFFDTRFLTELVQQFKPAKSFFRNNFFNGPAIEFLTREVDLPLWDGKRRIAYYTRRNQQSQHVAKIGYDVQKIIPAPISISDATTVEDLLKVMPGEFIQSGPGRARDNAVLRLAEQLSEFDDMVSRAEELQCKQALFDASIDLLDKDGNAVVASIDFDRDAELTMSATDLIGGAWSSTSNSKPLDDCDELRRRIAKHSGQNGNYVLFGEAAWRRFMNSDQVKAEFIWNRIEPNTSSIEYQMQADGGVFRGTARGFKFFTFDDWYRDDISTGKDLVPFVPIFTVLIGDPMAKTNKLYGAVDLIQDNSQNGQGVGQLFAGARVVDSWTKKDPDVRLVRMQSCPIMTTRQPNAYGTMVIE